MSLMKTDITLATVNATAKHVKKENGIAKVLYAKEIE